MLQILKKYFKRFPKKLVDTYIIERINTVQRVYLELNSQNKTHINRTRYRFRFEYVSSVYVFSDGFKFSSFYFSFAEWLVTSCRLLDKQ